MGQQRTMGQGQQNGQSSNSNPLAQSPVNGFSQLTPTQNGVPSPMAATPGSVNTNPGPSPIATVLSQQQERMRQAAQAAQAAHAAQSAQASASASTPTAPPQPMTATPGGPAQSRSVRPPVNPQAYANQQRQFVQSLAGFMRSSNQPLPAEIFNGERDGSIKLGDKWFTVLDLFTHLVRQPAPIVSRNPRDDRSKLTLSPHDLPLTRLTGRHSLRNTPCQRH